ncbi:Zonular occludens toxin (Zot) [compost metagenome]
MYVMAFDGIMGAGKTAGMSIMAQYYRQKSGCTLYSNYGLRGSKLFTNFEQFIDVAQQPSSIICLDEAHSDLDSRSSNTNVAKYLTHIFYYLRKLRATVFLSTPSILSLDSRVRGVTQIYCQVEKSKKYFKYNMYDLQSEKYLRTYRIQKDKAFGILPQVYYTHKMVVPMEYPQSKEEFYQIISLLKEVNDNYYIQTKEPHVPGLQVPEGGSWDSVIVQ